MVLGSKHAEFWQTGRQSPTVCDRHTLLAVLVEYNLFPMCCGTRYALQTTFVLPSMPCGGGVTGVIPTERTVGAFRHSILAMHAQYKLSPMWCGTP